MSRLSFRAIAAWWERYWFRPAPLFDLAVCRMVLVGTQVLLLVSSSTYNVSRLRQLAQLPDELYSPLPLLELFTLSPGGGFRPSMTLLLGVYAVTLLFGVAALVGFKTNASLLLFTLGCLFLQSFSYSFGDFHHPETVMMIALGALALAPSGSELSVDAILAARSRPFRDRGEMAVGSISRGTSSVFARWPLLLIRWMLGLAYLDAAVNKLYRSGPQWMDGTTLRWFLYKHGYERGNELAIWFADHHLIMTALSSITVVWEATFVTAVVFPVAGLVLIPLGIAMHVGMCATGVACFYQYVAAYSAFVPWSRLRGSLKTVRA